MLEWIRRRLLAWVGENPWPRPGTGEPLLYMVTWIGAIHVLFIDWTEDGFGFNPDLGMPQTLGWFWTFLMVSSPLQVLFAWLLIHYRRGRCRVLGMWNRLGGNIGICFGLFAFCTSRLLAHDFNPADGPLFGLIVISGVAAFAGTLVVRDILALYVLRRLADEIYRRDEAG